MEFVVRLDFLVISEATSIKSHQHDCPGLNWRKMALVDMTDWMGESQQGLDLRQRLAGNWGKLGGRAHQLVA